MFQLVAHIHSSDIGSLYWENPQQHARCHILKMSVNGELTNFRFTSWVIYVPIRCIHPFIKYWLPVLAKTTATCSLPQPENEHQQSINSMSCCISGNQGRALIFVFIKKLLTALIDQNTLCQR